MTKSKPDSVTGLGDDLPRIAITVGDVAGIGPELALRCASDPRVRTTCIPVLVGPLAVIRRIASELEEATPHGVGLVEFVDRHAGSWTDIGDLSATAVRPGRFDAATGRASYEAVVWAIDAALAGTVDAIVTGPIQKEAWHAAGIRFPGHTELLAERTGVAEVRMMLTADELSCVLVTIHLPLADVAEQLTVKAITRSIELGAAAMQSRVDGEVRVTVCGLNPHAGENGLFSHGEETNLIEPAIEAARGPGRTLIGPVPADTAFTPAMRARTDVYVCMYHDQGLIPLKAIAFDDAVNVTLGLPIIRTSVDHGTALDLAWKGTASATSMHAAIRMAVDLACHSSQR